MEMHEVESLSCTQMLNANCYPRELHGTNNAPLLFHVSHVVGYFAACAALFQLSAHHAIRPA